MKLTLMLLALLCLSFLGAPPEARQAGDEESSPARDAYLEFRSWLTAQPEEVRESDAVLDAYRSHLTEQGLGERAISQRIELLETGQDRQEVELWNRVLTAETPRFNTDPNEFLVRTIEGRKPGRALDVGMGQGRNAIWLARQGWEVTGFDPAEKAVALAHELAEKAGVTIATQTVGSEQFDWGVERWDLVVLSYVTARPWIDAIHSSLRPAGLVMLEAFHDDATKNVGIGRGVVYESNELLELFSGFRILRYEDTTAAADFGRRETRVVRLLAVKE